MQRSNASRSRNLPSSVVRNRRYFRIVGAAALAAAPVLFTPAVKAANNTGDIFKVTATDLTLSASYTTSINPTSALTTDVQFSGTTYVPPLTDNSATGLNFGTLNDVSTQVLTVLNNGTAGSITLNTAADSTSGSASTDLLYVENTGNLTLGGGSATLTIGTAVSGNIDAAGTGILNIKDALNIGTGTTLTLTGAGTTNLSGAVAATTGAVTVNAGTLNLTGAALYTGTTTLNGGTFNLGGGTSTGSISSSSPLALGGGTLNYTETGSATQSFASTAVNSYVSSVTVTAAGDTLNLGAISRASSATADFNAGAGSITTTTANTNGILGGWATVAGTSWAVSAASGGTPGNITGLARACYALSPNFIS